MAFEPPAEAESGFVMQAVAWQIRRKKELPFLRKFFGF